jgi:two-component system OmpR family response regulator
VWKQDYLGALGVPGCGRERGDVRVRVEHSHCRHRHRSGYFDITVNRSAQRFTPPSRRVATLPKAWTAASAAVLPTARVLHGSSSVVNSTGRDLMRVLVAEDDVRLADILEQSLSEAGWQVRVEHDGRRAFDAALAAGVSLAGSAAGFDVLLLDWGLPSMDGLTVCGRLRSLGVLTPILMLTARGATRDKIVGLDAGADDYLAKPFDLDELLARLRALYRRSRPEAADNQLLQVGDLMLDPEERRVSRAGTQIELSVREFDILRLLMERAGKVVSRYTILDEVWDGETDLRSNVIDVHVGSLRAKIDRPFGTTTIKTLRGAGYRVEKSTTDGAPDAGAP